MTLSWRRAVAARLSVEIGPGSTWTTTSGCWNCALRHARLARRFRGHVPATRRNPRTNAKFHEESGPATTNAHLLHFAPHRRPWPPPAIRRLSSGGTESSNSSTDLRPSCRLTHTTTPATPQGRNRIGLSQPRYFEFSAPPARPTAREARPATTRYPSQNAGHRPPGLGFHTSWPRA
jgi:hypothetical protein